MLCFFKHSTFALRVSLLHPFEFIFCSLQGDTLTPADIRGRAKPSPLSLRFPPLFLHFLSTLSFLFPPLPALLPSLQASLPSSLPSLPPLPPRRTLGPAPRPTLSFPSVLIALVADRVTRLTEPPSPF